MKNIKQKTENVHSGRRERMLKKLKETSPNSFQTHEVLEMLLYNVYPRQDTNVIAHNLLNVFGGIKNMFAAKPEAISAVKDVGEKATSYISLLSELFRRALAEEFYNLKLNNTENAVEYLKNLFRLENTEKLYVICTDARYKVISTLLVGEGDSESANFDADDVIKKAIMLDAKYIVITHNHVSGGVKPSVSDFLSTKTLVNKITASGIVVLDHIIISGEDCCSFKENSLMDLIYSTVDDAYETAKRKAKETKLIVSRGGTILEDEFALYLWNISSKI